MSFEIREFKRVDKKVVQAYGNFGVASLGHLTDFGFIKGLKPNKAVNKIVGPAITVKIPHLDSTALHLVFDYSQRGDVLVVDMSGDVERACWGGMSSYAAVRKGIAGAIIDGCICDVEEVDTLDFPVYSRGVSGMTTKMLGIEGEIGTPIAIANAVIHPGDLVFADRDGVAILSPKAADFYLPKIRRLEESESKIKDRLDKGENLSSISGAIKYVSAAND